MAFCAVKYAIQNDPIHKILGGCDFCGDFEAPLVKCEIKGEERVYVLCNECADMLRVGEMVDCSISFLNKDWGDGE